MEDWPILKNQSTWETLESADLGGKVVKAAFYAYEAYLGIFSSFFTVRPAQGPAVDLKEIVSLIEMFSTEKTREM